MNEHSDRAVASAVQKLAGTFNTDAVYLLTGKVYSVDENKGTCNVEAITGVSSTNIEGVEFQTTIANGILLIPKIDSEVKVLFSKFTTPFIVQYSDIEKVYLSGTKIQFNDGGFGGLVEVEKITEKLNVLRNQLTAELIAIAAGIASAGGSYTPNNLSTFVKLDYENKTVTHG